MTASRVVGTHAYIGGTKIYTHFDTPRRFRSPVFKVKGNVERVYVKQ